MARSRTTPAGGFRVTRDKHRATIFLPGGVLTVRTRKGGYVRVKTDVGSGYPGSRVRGEVEFIGVSEEVESMAIAVVVDSAIPEPLVDWCCEHGPPLMRAMLAEALTPHAGR